MTATEKVTQYIEKHPAWKKELSMVREILNESNLIEEVKWGAPCYTLNEKNLIGLAGFKNHAAIWFHQGALLQDPDNKLLNAQEGKTKALRQWRIHKGDTIDPEIVKKYRDETIANCKAGKEIKSSRSNKLVIPPILKHAFQKDEELKNAFETLTPGRRREYAEHINTAKREATKGSRLEKIKPMILNGVGLHDKYKNC